MQVKTYFIVSIIIWIAIALTGCKESVQTYDTPFIEMEQSTLILPYQVEFCKYNPDDMFCNTKESIGDIRPTKEYATELGYTMARNNDYKLTNEWYYNDTVYETLIGDCTNSALTIVKHMFDDGIDMKYVYLVYRLTSETTAHMFVAVDTEDGLIHIDAEEGNGLPIEEQINFHLPMTDVSKWIKGNI